MGRGQSFIVRASSRRAALAGSQKHGPRPAERSRASYSFVSSTRLWRKLSLGLPTWAGESRRGSLAKLIAFALDVLDWSGEDAMPSNRKKPIQEVAISEFKAKCLSLLKEVSKTKSPARVRWHGKAIADVVPTSPEAEERSWIASMSGRIKIVGDIVSPVVDTGSWFEEFDVGHFSPPTM
jgi:antitoxin (DNA-binding transcriptional repressor) of toxin-antitoxin stability system